jgi:DNA-binding response OmpR family regulator
VVETGDATAVVELTKTTGPDLVLLDVMFENAPPGVDGISVCRQLKSDADTKKVPVVMLSARDKPADAAAGRAAGAANYLAKPFGPIDLIDAIRSVLDLK